LWSVEVTASSIYNSTPSQLGYPVCVSCDLDPEPRVGIYDSETTRERLRSRGLASAFM
jgi:hypothetical protein